MENFSYQNHDEREAKMRDLKAKLATAGQMDYFYKSILEKVNKGLGGQGKTMELLDNLTNQLVQDMSDGKMLDFQEKKRQNKNLENIMKLKYEVEKANYPYLQRIYQPYDPFYNEVKGFILHLDELAPISAKVKSLKLNHCIFYQGGKPLLTTDNKHEPFYKEFLMEKTCYINKREIFIRVKPDERLVLYFELSIYMKQYSQAPDLTAWSIIKLFNKENKLISGQFQLPFYSHDTDTIKLLLNKPDPDMKMLDNTKLSLRISVPLDPELDSEKEFNEQYIKNKEKYMIPPLHLTQLEQTLQDATKLFNFNAKQKKKKYEMKPWDQDEIPEEDFEELKKVENVPEKPEEKEQEQQIQIQHYSKQMGKTRIIEEDDNEEEQKILKSFLFNETQNKSKQINLSKLSLSNINNQDSQQNLKIQQEINDLQDEHDNSINQQSINRRYASKTRKVSQKKIEQSFQNSNQEANLYKNQNQEIQQTLVFDDQKWLNIQIFSGYFDLNYVKYIEYKISIMKEQKQVYSKEKTFGNEAQIQGPLLLKNRKKAFQILNQGFINVSQQFLYNLNENNPESGIQLFLQLKVYNDLSKINNKLKSQYQELEIYTSYINLINKNQEQNCPQFIDGSQNVDLLENNLNKQFKLGLILDWQLPQYLQKQVQPQDFENNQIVKINFLNWLILNNEQNELKKVEKQQIQEMQQQIREFMLEGQNFQLNELTLLHTTLNQNDTKGDQYNQITQNLDKLFNSFKNQEEMKQMNLLDLIQYFQTRVNNETFGDYQKFIKENNQTIQNLSEYALNSQFEPNDIVYFLELVDEEDLVYIFKPFYQNLPSIVSEKIHSFDFEQMCQMYYLFLKNQDEFLDFNKVKGKLDVLKEYIKIHYFSLNARDDRPSVGDSYFYKILEVADCNDFYMHESNYL
ncbi:hypothetical protein PPERSA_00913 [Pseudocohnilembus persalinus]|uniref:Uncharacterized protein n=1 Tax=Pseudocohnilembus persalinus TaxID=266149 RepID=A0A0V0QEP8_PSEPJ|nr:hypothetical protein PPERSA_00913 [Pseudocohnilembus persalinus]|eukprot:KRX00686.1 hypothetical protein PPERSA_00913 [Pseudocohnilembus persalinus]